MDFLWRYVHFCIRNKPEDGETKKIVWRCPNTRPSYAQYPQNQRKFTPLPAVQATPRQAVITKGNDVGAKRTVYVDKGEVDISCLETLSESTWRWHITTRFVLI
jgi:hypothetical protein